MTTIPPLETQTSWLFHEMATGDGGNIAGTYRNSPGMSVSEAAIAFEQQYERSADTIGSSGMATRISNATSVYNSYQNGTLSSQPSNVQYVFNQALAQGYTPQQAAGIVGNLQRESGPNLDPNAVNPGDGRDGTDSIGIAQWNSTRAENLLNYDPTTGEVVPNEFVQEGDIGADGEPLTAEEAEEIREEARAANRVRGTSYYEPNELNDMESYTYNWAIHMIHPRSSHFPASQVLQGTDAYVTLAQSGVENEISIDRVVQTNYLTFSRENRSATANIFQIDVIEPAGFTLYNRLLYAAGSLGIENYLKACYILELNIRGWRNGQPAEVGPFYYNVMAESMPMQYRDGASYYQMSFYETTQVPFNRLEFHLIEDIPRISASTYGEFLSEFERLVNEQAFEQVTNAPGQLYRNQYILTTDGRFADWDFDAATGTDLVTTRGISVTGSGGQLDFSIAQGTSITAAMSMALYHTRNFRRILTTAGFALEEPADPEADPQELINLTQWVTYDTNVEFRRYDPLISEYEKILTYHSRPYIAPEVIHDPLSFEEMRNDVRLQRNRLANIFNQGILRKRYDYIYTGLNTEVLNLDIAFNNAFYTIQSVNSGAVRFTSQFFNGSGSELEREIADLRADALSTRSRINQLTAGIQRAQEELSQTFRDEGVGSLESIAVQQRIEALEAERSANEEALRILQPQVDRRFRELEEQGEETRIQSLNDVNSRLGTKYITQSQVTTPGSSKIVPNSFRYFIVDSLSTQGPEPGIGETPIGAAKLGAVEMNLLSLADMIEINLDVRGDPYWLGSQSEFDLGGPNYFLNLNFPTYPDPQTGLMSGVGDFSISGIYRVTEVVNYYQDGAWTQTLRSFLDTNTNYELLEQELLQGFVQNQSTSGVRTTAPVDSDGDGTISEEELAALENGDLADPDLIGTDQPGGHSLDPRLDADLANILIDSADATGVTLGNRSGQRDLGPDGRDSAGSTSGRHTHGHASDTELYMNGRLLSVNNPADLPYIQNFTREYLRRARAAGYQPSVGWGSNYMGGNAGHFDIAAGQNRRPDGNSIAPGYWGNGSSSEGAPAWLRDLYNS